jgi:hypothetical protein
MQNYLAAIIACGLVGAVVAYCEIQGWRGWQRAATFAGCGLMASLFAASPLMWQLLGLYSGAIEQIAVALSLGVGLWVVVDQVRGWV